MLLSYATCYFILKKFFTHTHTVGSVGTTKLCKLACNACPIFFIDLPPHRPMSSTYYYFVHLFIFSGFLRCYPSMIYMELDYNIHALIPPKDVSPQNNNISLGVINPATYAPQDVRTEG
jgi:hypothetical protein